MVGLPKSRTLTLRPNVKSVFTKIPNVAQLLANPTVVTVIVQAANCCYCSNVRGRVVASARTAARTAPAQRRRRRLLALLCHYSCAGQRRRPRGGTAMLQAIECASTYELRGEGESPDCANVGLPPPGVGVLLFTRLTVHHCCSPGLLLFCCYC